MDSLLQASKEMREEALRFRGRFDAFITKLDQVLADSNGSKEEAGDDDA